MQRRKEERNRFEIGQLFRPFAPSDGRRSRAIICGHRPFRRISVKFIIGCDRNCRHFDPDTRAPISVRFNVISDEREKWEKRARKAATENKSSPRKDRKRKTENEMECERPPLEINFEQIDKQIDDRASLSKIAMPWCSREPSAVGRAQAERALAAAREAEEREKLKCAIA